MIYTESMLGRWIVQKLKKRKSKQSKPLSLKSKPRRRFRKKPEPTQVEVRTITKTVYQSGDQASLLTTDLIRPSEAVSQSIQAFLLDQRSEHTRRAYAKDLKRLVKYLLTRREKHGPEKLDRLIFIAYKESLLLEKLEPATVDRHLASLRSLFRWLVEDGHLAKSPIEKVRFIHAIRSSRTNGFTDEEVRLMLALPDPHTKTGALHRAVLYVLFYCGLRRSELCSLRTSNLFVERDRPILRLIGKGNKERLIPIVAPVWVAIHHYAKICRKDLNQDSALFTPIRNNRTGISVKPIDGTLVFYIVRKYAKLAGIRKRVSPHSCRATAISNARDHQVSDRSIQEFAGWANANMITRYDKRKSIIEDSAAFSIDYG